MYMYCHNSYFHLSSGGIFYVYFHLHGRGFLEFMNNIDKIMEF